MILAKSEELIVSLAIGSASSGSLDCIITNEDRVKSILYKLCRLKCSPDEIGKELRKELCAMMASLPWELVEGKTLFPKDKSLQKFLRKANEIAKSSTGLLMTRNRAKADSYLRSLCRIIGCSIVYEGVYRGKEFRVSSPFKTTIKSVLDDYSKKLRDRDEIKFQDTSNGE